MRIKSIKDSIVLLAYRQLSNKMRPSLLNEVVASTI